ncbi:MAG: sulfur carrier protein ThiS [Synergistaceae bacterium]|jgi:sulfur carrier protein|nr:sulfur carrier protein ThiS [Synergistaceae bacterium]
MNLIIAGVKKDYPEGVTVARLLVEEKVETPMYVSVSINDVFVKRENFETTFLKEDDNVEFLYFMGGGKA